MKNRIRNTVFNGCQKVINFAYDKKGASDKVIDAQVRLNKLRNKHDIADKNELVYEEFVQ